MLRIIRGLRSFYPYAYDHGIDRFLGVIKDLTADVITENVGYASTYTPR